MPESEMFTMAEAAIGMHEVFLSYVSAGFSEDQALELIKEMIRSGRRDGS